MKKIIIFLVYLLSFCFIFAQDYQIDFLYRGGVYGQIFTIIKQSDGDLCQLNLIMNDNKNSETKIQTFDSELPMMFVIHSTWFSSPKEYLNAIEASKQFFNETMNLVYLADMKDICDIAPCCKPWQYNIGNHDYESKYIYIEYECNDLELLFKIAAQYNAKGRGFVLEKCLEYTCKDMHEVINTFDSKRIKSINEVDVVA